MAATSAIIYELENTGPGRGGGGWMEKNRAPFVGGHGSKMGCRSIYEWNLTSFIPKFFIPHLTTFQISFP